MPAESYMEEGEIIKAHYHILLGQELTDRDSSTRPITTDDILVVTPYNVKVNYLRSILPDNAKVGTVDKFQGQEAPIVLISMVTSSAEDLPRNIEVSLQQKPPECSRLTRTVFGSGGHQSQAVGNTMWHCRADEAGQHILLAG